ncbi:Hypothetical Protein FCC1311_044902 [Hondaea fermentalgiana]|uniref:Uncharacterized protein n=1 Tax=Hondaea fermentalgiana TaxID=2315210 RepID=A0A2R5GB88_9STRA|nr:Hypothetical Protein FCC1311_044902 [Hondaea fermentalgiana]|eukprot:GBG28267.1 Hypothetical Protein FCC1311_044902 [Hondaea fermentalgiana]
MTKAVSITFTTRSCVPQGDSLDGLVLVRVLDAVEVGDLTVTVECTAKTSITRKPLTVFSHATSRTAYIDALPRQRFVTPAIRGVVLNPGDTLRMLAYLVEAGPKATLETTALHLGESCSINIWIRNVSDLVVETVAVGIEETLTAKAIDYSSTIKMPEGAVKGSDVDELADYPRKQFQRRELYHDRHSDMTTCGQDYVQCPLKESPAWGGGDHVLLDPREKVTPKRNHEVSSQDPCASA